MRNEKGEITTDTAEIQKIINKRILWTIVCQQIWQPTRNGQLSRDVQPTKLNQEEIDQPNRPITRNEIEYVNKKKTLPTNKNPGPEGFTGKFCKHTKKNL